MTRRLLGIAWTLLLLAPPAAAEDEGYISGEELEAEITNRREDIARTDYRIETIVTAETAAMAELNAARGDGVTVEKQAVARARVLYRLTRGGGSLRFLLGASSPVDLLKRLSDLKRLLVEGLEARRQAGHRIAVAERRVASLREDKDAAFKMKDMLVDALTDLEAEKERRRGRSPFAR
jgi:hypothetical protein